MVRWMLFTRLSSSYRYPDHDSWQALRLTFVSLRFTPVYGKPSDTVLVKNTPIDYLDFASPEPGLGGKMGIDATHKIPPETVRDWGRPVTVDAATSEAIRKIAEALGI